MHTTQPRINETKKVLLLLLLLSRFSRVRLCATPKTAAYQASLSIANSWSSLKLMSIESVMPSSHLFLCQPFSSCLQSFPALVQFSNSVMSDSVQPHRRQPTRLPYPWDSPGENTGVGCHFLLQCMKVKSESEVAQSCPLLVSKIYKGRPTLAKP